MLYRYSSSLYYNNQNEVKKSSEILDSEKVKRQLRYLIPFSHRSRICGKNSRNLGNDILQREILPFWSIRNFCEKFSSFHRAIRFNCLHKSEKFKVPVFIIKLPYRDPSIHCDCVEEGFISADDNDETVPSNGTFSNSMLGASRILPEIPFVKIYDDPIQVNKIDENTCTMPHLCNDIKYQMDKDNYFLDRIEIYAPVLEQMRKKSANDPVVVVTNWQHSKHYPTQWINRFKEIVTRSLHPDAVFIETYGTDDQTEDLLMEMIQETQQNC